MEASDHEEHLLMQIAQRAAAVSIRFNRHSVYLAIDALMDVTACHLNGCPLRLQELLDTDTFNFAHDVFGIRRHLSRETGELGDCFLPRFADRSTTTTTEEISR